MRIRSMSTCAVLMPVVDLKLTTAVAPDAGSFARLPWGLPLADTMALGYRRRRGNFRDAPAVGVGGRAPSGRMP